MWQIKERGGGQYSVGTGTDWPIILVTGPEGSWFARALNFYEQHHPDDPFPSMLQEVFGNAVAPEPNQGQ